MNMKSVMLAKVIMTTSLDEFLSDFTLRDIERYLGLDTDSVTDPDAENRREMAKNELWRRIRRMAEEKLARLFDAMGED